MHSHLHFLTELLSTFFAREIAEQEQPTRNQRHCPEEWCTPYNWKKKKEEKKKGIICGIWYKTNINHTTSFSRTKGKERDRSSISNLHVFKYLKFFRFLSPKLAVLSFFNFFNGNNVIEGEKQFNRIVEGEKQPTTLETRHMMKDSNREVPKWTTKTSLPHT